MENDRHYFAVGVFALVTLAATAIFLVWLLGHQGKGDQREYAIYFDQAINGVNAGSVVRLKGIPVGTVKSIGFDTSAKDRIRLVTVISNNAPVNGTTRASVQLQGVTGLANISLNNKPELGDAPLQNDAEGLPTIPSEASALDQIFDKVPKMVDAVTDLAHQGQNLLSDQNVQAFTESMTALTKTLQSADLAAQSVARLSKNGQEFLGPDNNAELREMMAEGKLTLRELRYLAKGLREDPSQVIYKPSHKGTEPIDGDRVGADNE